MRAIKRIRYGGKELQKLKEIVEKAKENEATQEKMVKKLEENFSDSMITDVNRSSEDYIQITEMEVDRIKPKRNKKTMKDEHGQYPEWMNGRRLKKQKLLVKKILKKKKATK